LLATSCRRAIFQADGDSIASARPSASNGVSILEAIRVRFAFDDDLQSSRVYRMVKNHSCEHSLPSSAVRTQSWSIFSGLSLADISNISVVALPLYPGEFHTDVNYYSLAQVGLTGLSEANGTGTNAQAALETNFPMSSSADGGARVRGSLSSVVNDATVSIGSFPPRANIPGKNDTSLATCVQADTPQIHMKILLDSKDQRPKTPPDIDGYTSFIKSLDLDRLSPCCRGCGMFGSRSSVKDIRLAGHRWHESCFPYQTRVSHPAASTDANLLAPILKSSKKDVEFRDTSNVFGNKSGYRYTRLRSKLSTKLVSYTVLQDIPDIPAETKAIYRQVPRIYVDGVASQ
jgi:hypothetical protein